MIRVMRKNIDAILGKIDFFGIFGVKTLRKKIKITLTIGPKFAIKWPVISSDLREKIDFGWGGVGVGGGSIFPGWRWGGHFF